MGSSIKFDPDWRERPDKANKGNQKLNGKARHLAGILGVDKEVNRKDRAVDIELPIHRGANNMHPYPHPDQGNQSINQPQTLVAVRTCNPMVQFFLMIFTFFALCNKPNKFCGSFC